MKSIATDLKIIIKKQPILFIMMIFLALLSLALLITSLVVLDPNAAVTIISYSDLDVTGQIGGGYSTGMWTNTLTFSILAIVVGFLHNGLAIRIFDKKGADFAKVFVVVGVAIIVGAFFVLFRLAGES